MHKNIVVVGMPRSGTSMLAGIFGRRGYHVADDSEEQLRPADADNPGGYWEAERLIDCNVEIFKAAGYEHHNTWLFDAMPREVAKRIATLEPLREHREFIKQYEANSPWLWKDPRLCYTLAYWWRLLDPDKTRVLLTDRDPLAIYRSFLRLGWREPSVDAEADVLQRVKDHMGAAREAIEAQSIPHLNEPYERFANEPELVAESLSAFLGMTLTVADLDFDNRYNHSTAWGRIKTNARLRVQKLPPGVKSVLKRLLPRNITSGGT